MNRKLNLLLSVESPLTFAAHLDGVVELIKVLKSGGAHLDFRAKDGMTSLHKAARSKNQVTLTVTEPHPPARVLLHAAFTWQ